MVRPISFLSDYGVADEFVGVVHGVIARLAPEARVLDVAHGIPRHNVLAGALALERALPYVPAGVHLAVVDPEVGARRRAVAIATAEEDRILVGPDNGLLVGAAERFGGITEAVEISLSPWRLEPVSATFHGRDVFAPVAARLALGEPLAEAGQPMDPADLVVIDRTRAERIASDAFQARVVSLDAFVNAQLDAVLEDAAEIGVRIGTPLSLGIEESLVSATFARAFADVAPGSILVYEDAAHALAVAVNCGSAADILGLAAGHEVRIIKA